MLKIKDNIDLKELENFGFEIKYSEKTGEPEWFGKWNATGVHLSLYIHTDRTIRSDFLEGLKAYDNILYDLIKADIIEKVE